MTSHNEAVKYVAAKECMATDNFPHISIKCNTKILPIYANTLTRSSDGLFLAEDLDKIQLELETLLSKVALRYRVVQSDYDLLDKDEKRIERRKKHADKPSSPGKRKRDDIRKLKTSLLKHVKVKSSPSYSLTQYENDGDILDPINFISQQSKEFKVLAKNDTPNKFWLSVEPYCMPITNEDLKVLDDLVEQYCAPLVPPIPDLGLHYTKTRSEDNLKEVMCNSRTLLKSDMNISSKFEKISLAATDAYITGPITQRLVSAIMEEGFGSDILNSCSTSSSEINYLGKSFSYMKTGMTIEKKLEKELIAQGILESEEYPQDGVDEVLEEIKYIISEISSISEYNGSVLGRLREACLCEIARFDKKKKLDIIDHHILETYRKTISKKKALSTEIQQDIFRIISEQKVLSDQREGNYL